MALKAAATPSEMIVWSDDVYSVGITVIDEQHKELVGIINALIKVGYNADKEYILKVLNTLQLYAQNHFSYEEKIMNRMHYPKYVGHHNIHTKFTENVKMMKAKLNETNNSKEIFDKVIDFLKKWITQHILVEDREYSEYLLK